MAESFDMRAAVLLLVMSLAGCTTDPGSARGVAEQFLDAHYVRIDLPAAEALAAGLARKKIQEERRLTAGQEIDEGTRQPSVYYRFLEDRPDGDGRSRIVYRATFSVSGSVDLERRILLVMRQDQGAWRVVNFEEFE